MRWWSRFGGEVLEKVRVGMYGCSLLYDQVIAALPNNYGTNSGARYWAIGGGGLVCGPGGGSPAADPVSAAD